MAGNNNRVHGYNPLYQNPGPIPNFASFDMGANPGPFINRPVAQVPAPTVFDHQGHIVSQQTMNLVLNDMMIEMSDVCDSAADVNVYIAHPPHNAGWMADAVNYGNAFNIPMFDFTLPNTLANAEDRVGNLFSIVTWNPVNICRAPSDDYRNGVPGNDLDALVLAWLNANPGGVDAAWLAALNVLNAAGAAPTIPQVRAYLAASTATLPGQQLAATGYYSFLWQANGIQGLVPA